MCTKTPDWVFENSGIRTELIRLRKQVHEQEKDLEFLGKAAAYFATNPPKQNGSR